MKVDKKQFPNAIFDKCLNGYSLVEYNGNEKGDWLHAERCPHLACLPAPKHKLVDDQGELYENIKFMDGAWREAEWYEELLEEGYGDA